MHWQNLLLKLLNNRKTELVPYLKAFYTAAFNKGLKINTLANGIYQAQKNNCTIYFSFENQSNELHAGYVFNKLWIENKPELLASVLNYHLQGAKRLYARNCSVKRISKAESIAFFNKHHFLGGLPGAYPMALFYKNECRAVALFSKGRRMKQVQNPYHSYELLRFANHQDFHISGGLSKLVQAFKNFKKTGDIMTYVDQRYYSGKSYVKIGFKTVPSKISSNLKLVYVCSV